MRGILAVAILLAATATSTQAQNIQLMPIDEIRALDTDHGKHALLGTALDSGRNRMGLHFTCDPEPTIVFQMGFYPDGIPVTLMIGKEPFTKQVVGGPRAGFFAPKFTGKKALDLADFALQPGRTVTNNANAGFVIQESLEGQLVDLREDLPCL